MHSEQCTRSAPGRDGNADAAHTKRHLKKEQGPDIKTEVEESSAARERQQDLQALQNCIGDIRNGSQRVGNGKQGLENMVKDAERAVDLVRRETSLLHMGLQTVSKESKMYLEPGGIFDDHIQHLLEILQSIKVLVRMLCGRNRASAVIRNKNDSKIIRGHHERLRTWRKDFNNDIERFLRCTVKRNEEQ